MRVLLTLTLVALTGCSGLVALQDQLSETPTVAATTVTAIVPSPTATAAPTLAPEPTTTPTPAGPAVFPVRIIDACAVDVKPNYLIAWGLPAEVHPSYGEPRRYCLMSPYDTNFGDLSRSATILGHLPEPELLQDQDGHKLEYLGVRDYSFTWRKGDESLLALPIFYPRWLGTDMKYSPDPVAPVLKWSGGTDQRLVSGWQIELVKLSDGKPLIIVQDPFIRVGKSQVIRYSGGRETEQGQVPPHYELIETDNNGDPVGTSGRHVGLPLRIQRLFEPPGAKLTDHGQVTFENQQHRLKTAVLPDGEEAVGILGVYPVQVFVNQAGKPLGLLGIQEYTFAWFDSNGDSLAMPAVYPAMYDGKSVAPIFLCPKCSDSALLHKWQVWLVDVKTGETVKVIENPMVTLAQDESLVFNYDTGYFEVVKDDGTTTSFSGKQAGLELPHFGPVAVIENVRVFKYPKEDIGRLRDVLVWFKGISLKWYQYIMDKRPFDLVWAPELVQRGWAGSAACCWTIGSRVQYGRIGLADRPPADASINLWFVVNLVHEAAHIGDQRGQVLPAKGVDACRARERFATETQRAFLTDLLNSHIDGKVREEAQSELRDVDRILAKGTFDWNPACRN